MRWILALPLLMVALGGCAVPASPTPVSSSPSSVPATQPPTQTAVPPTPTATALPATAAPTATPTPLLPAPGTCPASADVCVLSWPFAFQRPVDPQATVLVDPTYRYGASQDDKREPHHGVDFPNAAGTAVLAAGDGIVVVAGNDKLALYGWVTNFYGNLVVIEHPLRGYSGSVYTLYGHLSKINVQLGQNVHAGDKIGEVGSTGIAIGSHLHLEVRIGNDDYKSTRNPELWLVPLPGTGVLAGRVVDEQGNPVRTTITIQRIVGEDTTSLYPIETYAHETLNGDDLLLENFAAGDRLAGEYRLSLIYDGTLYERQLQIEAGKLTLVIFHVR